MQALAPLTVGKSVVVKSRAREDEVVVGRELHRCLISLWFTAGFTSGPGGFGVAVVSAGALTVAPAPGGATAAGKQAPFTRSLLNVGIQKRPTNSGAKMLNKSAPEIVSQW